MKTINPLCLIGVFSLLTAFDAAAAIFTPIGPVTFKLTLSGQNQSYAQISSRTNVSATATNITSLLKSSFTNMPINNARLLAMLTNSFNTNFPPGAKLAFRNNQLLVMDATGTNLVLDLAPILSIDAGNSVWSGQEKYVTTYNASGTFYSGNDNETASRSITLHYDDTAMTTADGTHVEFSIQGISLARQSRDIKTYFMKTSFVFSGTGEGTFKGTPVIVRGTVGGRAAGAP